MRFRDWAILWIWVMGGQTLILVPAILAVIRQETFGMVITFLMIAFSFIMALRATLPALDGFEELADLGLLGIQRGRR